MIITFHGAAREVGRSCVEVKGKDIKVIIDAGIKITKNGNEYPIEFDVKDVDAAFVSHAHLDHTGSLPLFNSKGMNCPIFTTRETKDIARILLKDSLHIELMNGEYPHYDESNIAKVLGNMRRTEYREEYHFKGMRYKLFDAGHIPGSASVLLDIDGKTLLYTGDIKTTDSELLYRADTNYGERIDVMITESTYGDREHPDREKEKDLFLKYIKDGIKTGGSVIIPVFGVGRAQEILLMLHDLDLDVPIFLDGMAKKVTDLFINSPKFLRDVKEMKQAIRDVEYAKGNHMRERVVKDQGIFVTTSGMMSGGPVMSYMKHLWNDSRTSILLTGYQAEGTNGRLLLESGKFNLDGQIVRVKGKVRKFDFSAHSGLAQLSELIKKVNPKILLINHGDPVAEDKLAIVARKMGIEVHTPNLGDSFEIEK